MSKKLDKQGQLALFEGPDAPKKVLNYVEHYSLCEEAEVLLFSLEDKEVASAYIERYALYDEAQVKMVESSCGLRYVKEYIKSNYLCDKAQIRIFTLPNAKDFAEAIIMTEDLCQEATDALLSMPNANEVLIPYFENGGYLSNESEVKMVNMPNNWEIFKAYIKEFSLSGSALEALLRRKDSKKYLLLYFEECMAACLSKEAEFMMLEHPDAQELIKAYRERYVLYPEAEEKWNEMQAAAK